MTPACTSGVATPPPTPFGTSDPLKPKSVAKASIPLLLTFTLVGSIPIISSPSPGTTPPTRKGKDPVAAAQVAASSSASPPTRGVPPLQAASRRFFAPCTIPLPHNNAVNIAARTPDIMAAVLKDSNCPHPASFSATVNARGALTLTCTNVHTPATVYTPYYEAMALRLNQSFPIGTIPSALSGRHRTMFSLPSIASPLPTSPLTQLSSQRLFPPLSRMPLKFLSFPPASSNPTLKNVLPLRPWQSRSPMLMSSVLAALSTSSHSPGRLKWPTPPPRTFSAAGAGSSAMTHRSVGLNAPRVPCVPMHMRALHIAAPTQPVQRVQYQSCPRLLLHLSTLLPQPQWHSHCHRTDVPLPPTPHLAKESSTPWE
ncbi:hypothetical protein C7212DRAFT_346435 [Tuber magnatum]|uniref:Uncharacterized protein n=1 Tax=Tuber magnatum TaxID=42249 RepID=A0A317SIF5_9PEZI|nr:hypothetical protein C7212DRAFT_346435 [Tuber magnatum]